MVWPLNRAREASNDGRNEFFNHILETLQNTYFVFQSSSCLSDRDEEDIYDFAAKYEGKSFIGKPKITSPG